jgi:hypothetical protein
MEILLNTSNDIYTVSLNSTSKTITITGVNSFPIDFSSIRECYDVTAHGYITPLSSRNQFAWFRSNGLPIFVYLFTRLPVGAAGSDTLNLLLDIPQNQSILSLQQKQATASAGTPGTLVSGEAVTGTINGTNKTFTLANTPITGAITLAYVPPTDPSQLLQYNIDFTVSGSTITMNTAPVAGSSVYAIYYH